MLSSLKQKLKGLASYNSENFLKTRRRDRQTVPISLNSRQSQTLNNKIEGQENMNISDEIINNIQIKNKKMLKMYGWNTQFYKSDEQKLLNAIQRQLRRKNYFYEHQLLAFMKTKKFSIKLQQEDIFKYQNQIDMVTQYLTNFYQKKKLKQINILQERIQDQQKFINHKVGAQDYESLYRMLSLAKFPSSILDIQEQYQTICMSHGRQDKIVHPHKNVKNMLQDSSSKLHSIFQANLQKKGNRQFIIKSSKKLKAHF